ncbi:MAG: S9 family peptidase [Bacteroides sp.]|nr:S9 family peptidase [Bacteroides sp.]MCM1085097.1 S9 family peptidase [Bacteroides sp.]
MKFARISGAVCLFGLSLAMVSCCTKNGAKPVIIDRQPVEIKDGRLSPEALWAMGRLGEVAVSPDGQYVAYSVRYYSVAENKGNTDLYLCDIDGQNVRRLTRTAASENNLHWLNEHTLAYLYPAGDGMQMFGIDLKNVFSTKAENGTIADTYKQLKPVQITSIPGGMEGFRLSPDQGKIAFVRQVQAEPTVQDRYPDLDKSSGMIFNDLNYRHWDEWVSGIPHIFISELSGADLNTVLGSVKASQPVDILKNEPYESPVKPFGGIEQFAWSADGQYLAYTCRKLTGKDYALSTNTDIYLYSPGTGSTVNLSEGMMGYDLNPVFSPDGKYLAWESMERDGYESDKSRLMLLDLQTSEKTDATRDFDQNANGLQWSADSKYIYFISNYHALSQIYRLEVESNAIECLTGGVHDYNSVYPVNENLLVGTRASMSVPEEMFSVDLGAADAEAIHPQTQISFINKDIMDRLDAGKVEERWIKTTDNKKMLAWVIYPPHFDPEKKYPALLYCQGGPQSTVSQFWSYRWNLQIMAANDYIIIAPNRRGLPGFGMEWLEQISGDYGGQNMKDYLSAIDDLCKEPYVDKDRLGCVGASYGAFSVYWLAGHHEKRFKGFIAHDGMFNLEQQYAETEELWFTNWDLGGPFWEKDNKVAQRSYANSPHRFVDKWDAPIFVIHGELDYRILASQGMAAFNSAVLRGIPAELLIFPDENHWVLQPQNGILWQRRFFRFLDKYVKGLSDAELEAKYYGEQAFSMKDPFGDQTQRVAKGGSKEQNTEKQVAQ